MASIDKKSSNVEKVVFFRSLFSGRGDVFAKRYDNAKTGKKGYSPYCENQWMRGLCGLMHGVTCSTAEQCRICTGTNRCAAARAYIENIAEGGVAAGVSTSRRQCKCFKSPVYVLHTTGASRCFVAKSLNIRRQTSID